LADHDVKEKEKERARVQRDVRLRSGKRRILTILTTKKGGEDPDGHEHGKKDTDLLTRKSREEGGGEAPKKKLAIVTDVKKVPGYAVGKKKLRVPGRERTERGEDWIPRGERKKDPAADPAKNRGAETTSKGKAWAVGKRKKMRLRGRKSVDMSSLRNKVCL